ncbi:hypothetical protein T08_14556 [Trichinella sp. T8]|nr:hypothetical protein T08_14556 [Trichinella sp. T8]
MHRTRLIIILIAKSPIEGYNVADQSEKSKDPNNSSYFQLTVAVRSKCAYHQRHLIVYILTEFQKLRCFSNRDEMIVSAMRIAFTFTVRFSHKRNALVK